jgi:RNA polymerase sigma-70 factor (ECF subfamily)
MDETRELEQAVAGNQESWNTLVSQQRDRLRRLVAFRMDDRLQGRIDPSDVIQEAMIEAWQRLPEFAKEQKVPLFVWLRTLTLQRLSMLRRTHIERNKRTVNREVDIQQDDSSSAMAIALIDSAISPSSVVQRQEILGHIQERLVGMDPIDREVLALRHFEQLGNTEVASVLGISTAAASLRYSRALRRLRDIISEIKGLSAGFSM